MDDALCMRMMMAFSLSYHHYVRSMTVMLHYGDYEGELRILVLSNGVDGE